MKPDPFEELAKRLFSCYDWDNYVGPDGCFMFPLQEVADWLRSNAVDIGAAWYQWENEPIDDV